MSANNKSTTQFARRIETHDRDLFAEHQTQPLARIVSGDSTELVDMDDDMVQIEPVYEVRKSTPWGRIWLALAFGAITIETLFGVWNSFLTSPLLGGLYGALALLSLGLISKIAFNEIRALATLKRLELVRGDAERLLQSEQVGEAERWLKPHLKSLPEPEQNAFRGLLKSHHTDKEIIQLFDSIILTKQDDVAQKIVAKSASGSALMVAMSPMATLDMLAVLWRGTKMIESISAVYGIRLGYRSRLKLYKMLLKQMVFVGSTELISDIAVTSLGAELLGKLSARSAQGLSAGVFTARLGLKTMELCRPLPRLEARPKRLKNVIKQVFTSISTNQPAAK